MASPPIARRCSLTLLTAALLFAGLAVLTPPATAHARGKKAGAARAAGKKTAAAPKASKAPRQPKIVPNQEGKVVLLPFADDDDRSIAALVERLLQARGLEVVTNVRGVDTAEQFRELAGPLGVAAFVDGTVREREGDKNVRVTVQLRSGYTGRRVALATFKETKLHLRPEMEDKLWTRLGPAMARACVDATKPRKRGRGPQVIEAGTPLVAGRDGTYQ
jgi:TolB-like protein